MVLADVDVICGIYPKKEINWQSVEAAVQRGEPWQNLKRHTASFVINLLDGAQSITTPVGMPFEILAGGTGCMLIKRHVIERMVQVVPSYISDTMDLSNTIDAGARIANVFDTSIDAASERLLSEDYHFCFKWREMGGKIHAAPWVQLTHTGNYNFEGGMIPEQNNG
jgi:hypothetical protein